MKKEDRILITIPAIFIGILVASFPFLLAYIIAGSPFYLEGTLMTLFSMGSYEAFTWKYILIFTCFILGIIIIGLAIYFQKRK